MAEGVQFANLYGEAESRWRLVETAWKIGISSHLIDIAYDGEKELLYVPRHILQRGADITSARDALNGYQKGRCFYCYRHITIQPKDNDLAHVDHVIAHYFKRHGFENLDGIWNLVLACQKCNNGEDGKLFFQIKSFKSKDVLFQYENNSIRMWKTSADFLRPKWGIYRSLIEKEVLRDEVVDFADFEIISN